MNIFFLSVLQRDQPIAMEVVQHIFPAQRAEPAQRPRPQQQRRRQQTLRRLQSMVIDQRVTENDLWPEDI